MSLIDEIQKNPENIKSIGYLSEGENNSSRLEPIQNIFYAKVALKRLN